MKKILIKNYGILLYSNGLSEKVEKCTTFTDQSTIVVEFATIEYREKYIQDNKIIFSV